MIRLNIANHLNISYLTRYTPSNLKNKGIVRKNGRQESEEQHLNIQIFGKTKCFETKKAERYFKERGIKYQFIDMKEKGMSKGELSGVKQALGGMEVLIDEQSKDKNTLALIKYLSEDDKEEKLLENQQLFKTPIVRNGKKATIGYQPDIWKTWE